MAVQTIVVMYQSFKTITWLRGLLCHLTYWWWVESKRSVIVYTLVALHLFIIRILSLSTIHFALQIFSWFFFLQTRDGSPWTENNKLILPSGETRIEVDNTLAIFSNWVQQNSQTITEHDHVMLFTKWVNDIKLIV